ncbi:hypothetical protein K501DRAFT_283728 [Backusella circina FSU 941]|nr:hypothetical protein K501DRAFT_283728 [Backusella circina FSU 941]
MASGYPLDDDDRWPWLRLIRDRLVEESEKVKDTDEKSRAVIVTCSSLKKVYRDVLRDIPTEVATVTFVYLKGTPELLLQRIQGRKGHFMPSAMLQSQLDTLEEPNEETESVIVTSIVPAPGVQAEHILKTASERGLLHSSA